MMKVRTGSVCGKEGAVVGICDSVLSACDCKVKRKLLDPELTNRQEMYSTVCDMIINSCK